VPIRSAMRLMGAVMVGGDQFLEFDGDKGVRVAAGSSSHGTGKISSPPPHARPSSLHTSPTPTVPKQTAPANKPGPSK
jgi:hypothetical protein